MSNKQETLIYIEKETYAEADFMSRNFVNKEVRNRAYINTLGAELVIKYLKSEGINTDTLHNIHSISKILENIDIADIILPNIHIDVRTVFDKSQIFIPKSHYELGITPDVYIVLVLDSEFKFCEFSGYFTPDMVNKNNANSAYYFMEPEKLYSPDTLIKFIKDFTGKTSKSLTDNEMFRGRELSVSMADHNTSNIEFKELLTLLVVSSELRESIIEYDNFETLAYNTVKETDVTDLTPDFDMSTTFEDETESIEDETNENKNNTENESFNEDTEEEEELNEQQTEDVVETFDIDTFEELEPAETQLDENLFDEYTQTTLDDNQTIEEQTKEDEIIFQNTDPVAEIENIDFNIEELPVETLDLDEGIGIDIDNNTKTSNEKTQDTNIGDTVIKTAEVIGDIALGAGAIAAAAAGAEIASATGATSEAIKLAGVAGDVLDDILEQNVQQQQQNLEKLDYTNIDTNATEIPEEIASIISVPTKSETLDDYVSPTDLSELEQIDNPLNKQEVFEHETVDLEAMETIETEKFTEASDNIVNLDNINVESPTKPVENLSEIISNVKDDEGINLPDVSHYSLDDLDTNDDAFAHILESEQHLTEFPQAELSDDETFSLGEELTLDTEHLMDLSSSDSKEEVLTEDVIEDLTESFTEDLTEGLTEDLTESFTEDLPKEITEDFTGNITEDTTEELTEDLVENFVEENLEEPETIGLEDDLSIFEEESFETEIPQDIVVENYEEEEKPVGEAINVSDEPEYEEAELNFSDFEDIDFPETEDNLEQDLAVLEENSPEIIEETEEVANIEDANEIFEPELDEEFMTDLNTEIDADETLHDAEPVKDLENDAIIENPEEQIPTVFENSTVISDKTFTVGEIPIDINVTNVQRIEDTSELGNIYNPEANTPSMLQTPGKTGKNNSKKGSGGILGALLTLVVVCAIGFGVAKMFKAPTEEAPQPTTDDSLTTDTAENSVPNDDLNVGSNSVVNMEGNTNPLVGTTQTPMETPLQTAKNNNGNIQQTAPAKKATSSSVFLEVKKLSWEVPDYLAYNPQFKQYFQAVGRSLKLSLTTDLLLATEYPYSSEIKVTLTFNKDGSFKEARVVKSSGSNQIDKIVLQTVNQTLKVLKAPPSVGNDENTVAILKIYL